MANKTNTPAPQGETKRQKFTRLGAIRVSKALKAIDIVGNLSTGGYEYGPNDVAKIKNALQGQLDKTLAKFSADKSVATQALFTL